MSKGLDWRPWIWRGIFAAIAVFWILIGWLAVVHWVQP